MNCSFTLTKDGRALGTLEPGDYTVVVTTPVPFANPDQQPGIVYLPICEGAAQVLAYRPGRQPPFDRRRREPGPGAVHGDAPAERDLHRGRRQRAEVRPLRVRHRRRGAGREPGADREYGYERCRPSGTTTAGKLAVSTTTTGAVRLALGGKPVVRLHQGVYTLVLVDPSAKAGFVLHRAGGKVIRVTTARFVGRASKRVELTAGRWLLGLGSGKTRVLDRVVERRGRSRATTGSPRRTTPVVSGTSRIPNHVL